LLTANSSKEMQPAPIESIASMEEEEGEEEQEKANL
jgi:hypothetical protein